MNDDEKGDIFDFSKGDFRYSTFYIKSPVEGGRPIRIPFQRPPPVEDFIDREEELTKLLVDLQPGRVVTLCGPGGIGKSALASKAVWKLAPEDSLPDIFPDGLVYYSFDKRAEIVYAYEHIVRSYDEEAQDTSQAAALRALAGRQALLILEGTEQADDLPALLQTRGGCALLITSRRASDAVSDRQDLLPLPLDFAVELLQINIDREITDRGAAHGICEILGGLPMAISLVGKYLSETGESLDEYLKWLKETPMEALDPDEVEDRLRSVPYLLERSLTQVGAEAVQVMALSGLFALSPFSQEAVAEALRYSTSSLRRALRRLTDFGLLKRIGDRYEVTHHLLYTYVSQQLTVSAEASNLLVSHFIRLAEKETEKGLPGYLRLDVDREHIIRALEWCMENEQWTAALDLFLAVDTYLDVRGHWFDRVKVCELSLVVAHHLGNIHLESACYMNLGAAYGSLGDFGKAIEYNERSLKTAREIGNRSVESKCYTNLGNTYHRLGDFGKAIKYHEKALEIKKESGDRSDESGCYMNLGNAYGNLGDFGKAIEYHERSLKIAREIGDRSDESACYTNLGNAYGNLGDFGKAIEYHERSLKIERERGGRSGEATCYTNLGNAYQRLGDFGKAIEYHERSLKIMREIGNRSGESKCYGNLGNAYQRLGDFGKAIEFYERSLEIMREIGDRYGESTSYMNLGAAYGSLGDFGKAIEYNERSLKTDKEIGNRSGESKCYTNLGNAYYELGEVKRAIGLHEKALEIDIEIGDRAGEAACYANLGNVYHVLGEVKRAIGFHEKALEIDIEIGDKAGESKCYDVLSSLYDEMGDQEKANEYREYAHKLTDENP